MSSIASSSSSSANMYSRTQADYLKRSSETVEKGLIELSVARDQGKDLGEVFFSLLDSLAKSRREIAEVHEPENAWLFGRSRMYSLHYFHFTCLGEKNGVESKYKSYNDRMLKFLQEAIKGKIPVSGNVSKTDFLIQHQFEERKCSFNIQLITKQKLVVNQWDHFDFKEWDTALESLKRCRISEFKRVDEKDFPATESDQVLLKRFHCDQRKLKKHYSDLYIRGKMKHVLQVLDADFPSPQQIVYPDGRISHSKENEFNLKSIYVLAKVRVEIDKKMYALSEYLTWTYRDFEGDPVVRLGHSSIYIIHQDRYLIDDTLKEISKLFKKALQWERSKGDLKELKMQVALIRYLFAHAMPYCRGSAAIGEWLEEIIYRDRGLIFRRIAGKSGDLEAFVAPLWSNYFPEYDKTISITGE